MKTLRGNKTLAIILSVAMILSSENFALYAHATERGTSDGYEIAEDVETVAPVFTTDGSGNGGNGAGDNGGGNGAGDNGGSGTTENDPAGNTGTIDDPNGPGGEVEEKPEEIIVENPNDDFGIGEKSGILRLKPGTELSALKGTVKLPAGAKKIPAGIFSKNTDIVGLTIPENSQLAEIEAGAFEGSGIKEITIPDGVTQIPDRAFKNSALISIQFGTDSKLTAIGEEAFLNCKITGMTTPGLVVSIGSYAFSGCSELTNVQLANVESIGDSAFKNCVRLDVVGWSKKLKSIGNSAFFGCALKDIKGDAEFGVNIIQLGASVFENCSLLSTVVLHSNLKQISEGMFRDCVKLNAITLPADCTVIEGEAFSGCTALKKVTIPRNVNRIRAKAFADCLNLTEVTIQQRNGAGGVSDIVLDRDAFPQKDLTMKGYDGTVEDYANEKGYTYKSLYETYKITLSVGDHGSATLSQKTAKPGEVIEVSVSAADGYRLKAAKFMYNDTKITKLKEEKSGKQVFTFVMPEEDVKVTVNFEAKNASMGSLSAEFEQVGQMTYDWDRKAKQLTFDRAGLACRLVIVSSKIDCDPGPWMFTYTSSKSKVATVDSEGVIYARGEGEAKITATLKSNLVEDASEKKIEVKVVVKADSGIDHYSLSFSNLKKAKLFTEEIDGEIFSIIQYTKANLKTSDMDFEAELVATAGSDPTNLFTKSTWKVFNPDMVTLEKETVEDNVNTVKVLKETVGETAVTVTVTNGKTGKDKETLYEKSFIIRVIDVTPRLLQETVTLNARCTSGTVYELLSVYGYEVNPNSLRVVQSVKKKGSNGKYTTDYEVTTAASYASCRYSNGRYYLDLTEDGKRFMQGKTSKTYTNMFLEGEYSYLADNGVKESDTFRTKIPSLVLVDKDVRPTVKFSGKINLFFNSKATLDQQGQVQVTQSLKDLIVEEYALVSEANWAKEGSEEIDSLANNFVIDKDGVINRSDKPLIKDAKGKPVVKGYLKIKYEGYNASYVKITIPTQNKKPTYILSKSKVTVNMKGNGYRVPLQVLDKKTKKAISLSTLAALSFDQSSAGTTMGLFEDMDTAEARETDVIVLQIKRAQKGKAVINVEMESWNEPMKFTMNLTATDKLPTVKAKPTTLTLNNLCIGKTAETVLKVNQDDAVLADMDRVEYAGKSTLAGDAPKISFHYDKVRGVLSVVAGEELATGIYKFRVTPNLEYCNGQTEFGKPIVLNVKVIGSKLSAVPKPATVTMNNRYVGIETGVIKYTIKNMPVGNSVKIISRDVTITGTNPAAESYKDAFDFDFASDQQTISVRQNSMVRSAGYKYTVSGLKAEIAGRAVEIQPFKITVKVVNKVAKLTATAKGTLNIGNSDSGIVYTLKLTNINTTIDKVVARQLDTTDGLDKSFGALVDFDLEEIYTMDDSAIGSMDGTNDGTTDGTTDGSINGGTGGVRKRAITAVKIKANNNILNTKKKYKIRLGVVLPGQAGQSEEIVWTKDLAIKPKQILPKIKVNVENATLYAGVPIGSPKRSQEIRITKTTESGAEIVEAGLASGNPDNIKKAFKVTYDPVTQKAKLTLIRPDLVLVDTEYVVTMEARVRGQMANSKGATFSITVKVLN